MQKENKRLFYSSPQLERIILEYNGLIAQSLEDPNEGEEWIWEG